MPFQVFTNLKAYETKEKLRTIMKILQYNSDITYSHQSLPLVWFKQLHLKFTTRQHTRPL